MVGEAREGAEAVIQVETLHPDVILMDLMMPKKNGIRATCAITAGQAGARSLFLTSSAGD